MSRFPRTSLAVICLLALFSFALPAQADRAADGKAYIQKTIDEFIALLRDKTLTPEKRLANVEALAIDRFDLERMSKLVLGKNRRKLSDVQQAEFREEFKEHIALTYGHNLESYSDETVEIGDARLEKNGDVTVQTKVVGGSADGIVVTYRLFSKDDNPWRVIDVVIEGVSTVQNFRAQIQDIVSNKGVDHLIQVLRDKNAQTAANKDKQANAE